MNTEIDSLNPSLVSNHKIRVYMYGIVVFIHYGLVSFALVFIHL